MTKPFRIFWSIFIVCALLTVGSGYYFWRNLEKYLWPNLIPPESFWVDMDKPLREQVSEIEINGVTLRIPTMYIGGRLQLGKKQDSVLLEVIWPDMRAPLELGSREKFLDVQLNQHLWGQILLEKPDHKTPFDDLIVAHERGLAEDMKMGTEYGLEKHYHERPGKPPVFKQEVYLERDKSGHIVTFIDCFPDGKVPYCNQAFFYGDLYYYLRLQTH